MSQDQSATAFHFFTSKRGFFSLDSPALACFPVGGASFISTSAILTETDEGEFGNCRKVLGRLRKLQDEAEFAEV